MGLGCRGLGFREIGLTYQLYGACIACFNMGCIGLYRDVGVMYLKRCRGLGLRLRLEAIQISSTIMGVYIYISLSLSLSLSRN